MTKVLIYQIGYGQWGSVAFEKFLQLKRSMNNIDIAGICDIKPDRRAAAENTAKKAGLTIGTFSHSFDMYKDAIEKQKQGNIILIYDAGPSELHAAHLIKSMEHGFFHVAEKPPFFSRREKRKIDELTEKHGGRWTVDLIEDESPVVKTALEYARANKIRIKRIGAYRYNSIALKKLAFKEHRLGVTGGDLLDKLLHEAYLSRFLENYRKAAIKKARCDFFMISSVEEPKIIGIHGKLPEKKDEIATAQSSVEGLFITKNAKIPFALGSGWLGVPDKIKTVVNRIEKQIGSVLIFSQIMSADGKSFADEELRIFTIEGTCGKSKVMLLGDMKNKKLYENAGRKWKQLNLIELEGDQLYRVLRNAVSTAEGKEGFSITRKEIDFIMDIILEARKKILKRKINLEKEAEKTKKYVAERVKS